jgi:hypothetical protein
MQFQINPTPTHLQGQQAPLPTHTGQALREAQRRFWPDSIFLARDAFVIHASRKMAPRRAASGELSSWDDTADWYLRAYPAGVFYRCGPGSRFLGFRYGILHAEYFSIN